MRTPVIYFAGKMSDWRQTIVGPSIATGGEFEPVDCGTFCYGGPFLVSSDHNGGNDGNHGAYLSRSKILAMDLECIRRADIVFAYIDGLDCFGTLIELGVAIHKPIAVGFGPRLHRAQQDDLWMARCLARAVYYGTLKAIWRRFELDFLTHHHDRRRSSPTSSPFPARTRRPRSRRLHLPINRHRNRPNESAP
jgi:hypothetical protein